MQKKIIALAIAAAVSTPAFADTANVTVYGVANVSFDSVDNGTATNGTQGTRTNKVSSNTSRIGFKGAEDLGDGLTAVWQVESFIALDNAGGTFGTRNTFAGLAGKDWGTVLLGRHDTPYKLATRKLDVFGDTIADNRTLLGGVAGKSAVVAFDGRQTDVAAYLSPVLNGFAGAVAYVAGAESATLSTQTKGSAWSVAGWYDAAPFYGALAYEVHDFGSVGTGNLAGGATTALAGTKESATKLGVGYTLDALNVNAIYERTSDSASAARGDLYGHNAYYLSGQYGFGNDAVKLAYGKQGNVGGVASTGANQVTLGYDRSFSKRTKLYAIYTSLKNDSAASYALSSATVASGTTAAVGAGAKVSALSLGLKHSF